VIPQMLAAASVVGGERRSLSKVGCAANLFGRGAGAWSAGEPPHDIDQLVVGIAGRIAEFGNRVCIGKLAQTEELADALPPAQLQLGRPMSEQNPPQLALTKEMVEFGRRDVDQEQNQDPDLDRGKAMPGKGRGHMRQKLSNRIVLDQPEPDKVFKHARNEYDSPVKYRFE